MNVAVSCGKTIRQPDVEKRAAIPSHRDPKGYLRTVISLDQRLMDLHHSRGVFEEITENVRQNHVVLFVVFRYSLRCPQVQARFFGHLAAEIVRVLRQTLVVLIQKWKNLEESLD